MSADQQGTTSDKIRPDVRERLYLDLRSVSEKFTEFHRESGHRVMQQLFYVNAGGAVAVLTYLGTVSAVSTHTPALMIALGCFTVGVILVQVANAIEFAAWGRIARQWRGDTTRFWGSQLTLEQVVLESEKIAKGKLMKWGVGTASAAFAFFVAGCVIGFCLLVR